MRYRTSSLLALLLLLLTAGAWACNVPVFRYALDHWRPDAYQAIVVHNGQLSSDERAAIDKLKQAADGQRLNLRVKQVDATQSTDLPLALSRLDVKERARLLLYYPANVESTQPALSMDLNSASLDNCFDSPLRRELCQRLASGQSAVWLFVAQGDTALIDAARSTLTEELTTLQSTLELPKLTDDPDDAIRGGPELRIEFSVLELKADDPAESALRQILLGSEADLKDLGEPMVFPVFGCGRALWPLVGAGINAENIRQSASFVAGACSCQVKEQNPGFDLLINADWNELLPWTKETDSNHNSLNQESTGQIAETVPIPGGSNMSQELLAMGVGTAAAGGPSGPGKDVDTSDFTGSMFITVTIAVVVALAAIAVLRLLKGKAKPV